MKMKFNFIEIFPEKNWINFLLLPLKLWAKQNTRLWMWVQFSHSVVSDSLQPHGLQHTRPLCPSPTHGIYPNSCPLSQWCHPIIPSSVVPFSCCLQSFPATNLFKWVSSLNQVAKVLEFQLQHQSFQRTPGLISFRMDWLDLLAVQRLDGPLLAK